VAASSAIAWSHRRQELQRVDRDSPCQRGRIIG
jgi:hypothetical protein